MGRAYGEMASHTFLPLVMWLVLHSLGTGNSQVVSEFLMKQTVLCVVEPLCPGGEEESRVS